MVLEEFVMARFVDEEGATKRGMRVRNEDIPTFIQEYSEHYIQFEEVGNKYKLFEALYGKVCAINPNNPKGALFVDLYIERTNTRKGIA